jgi:predicted metal-dependent enzyme (double-stranded beta helix superfamily)
VTTDIARLLERVVENDEFRSSVERCARAFPLYRSRLPLLPYAYSRTRLIARPEYEVVVMQWAPGSCSPIHNHGLSRCWVLMLEGSLDVWNYERDDAPTDAPVLLRAMGGMSLRSGDVDHRLMPRELHRVRNTTQEPAFSLQLYAEPIQTYAIVDERSCEARNVSASCDLVLNLDEQHA